MSPNGAIERILEVSAEAQIKRREAAEDSPAFHNLTGAIIAYGKALGLLSKLKEVQTEPYSNDWLHVKCRSLILNSDIKK